MKTIHLMLLVASCIFLFGCPTGTDFPLEPKGNHKIDPKLIGTWKTKNKDYGIAKFVVEKIDDYSYRISVLKVNEGCGYPEDIDPVVAWLSMIKGDCFLVVQSDSRFYHYQIKYLRNGQMLTDALVINEELNSADEFYSKVEYTAGIKLAEYAKDGIKWQKVR